MLALRCRRCRQEPLRSDIRVFGRVRVPGPCDGPLVDEGMQQAALTLTLHRSRSVPSSTLVKVEIRPSSTDDASYLAQHRTPQSKWTPCLSTGHYHNGHGHGHAPFFIFLLSLVTTFTSGCPFFIFVPLCSFAAWSGTQWNVFESHARLCLLKAGERQCQHKVCPDTAARQATWRRPDKERVPRAPGICVQ